MTIGGASEMRAFIQGPSEAVAGLLSGELIDIDPEGAAAVIGQSPKDVTAKASATQPVETKVPIAVAMPHTVPVGHQIAVRLRITFVGTSGHTLFYDSDKYPSGVKFQTGQVITHEDCPAADRHARPGPVASPSTPSRRAEALDDLPALDQVGQERLELVAEVGAVEGQLDGRPEEVDLLADVVAAATRTSSRRPSASLAGGRWRR